MGKRKATLKRERREVIGDRLASLLMRLYILHTRHDGQGVDALSRPDARPTDMGTSTWTAIAGALLDAGWTPPAGWEEAGPAEAAQEGGLLFPAAGAEED